jgi:hypothetical protein
MIRTRVFVSAATLLLCAGVSSVASAQAPAESMLVMRVDVAGIVGSDLYKQLTTKFADKMTNKDPKYLEFKEATGINPETDIKSMTLGIAGDFSAPNPKMYCILDGKFDQSKLEAYAKAKGKLTVGSAAGMTTFTPTETEGGQKPPTFAVLNANTLIAASSEDFEAFAGSAKSGGVPMAAALKTILSGEKGQIQLALILPATAKENLKANPQSAALANVESVAFTADLSAGMLVSLKASADSEANGKSVYDAINGFIALGKMMSAEQPAAQKVMNDLKIEQAGGTTAVSLNVKTEDVVDMIGQTMAVAGAAAGGAPAAGTTPAAGKEEGGEEEEAPAEETPKPQN